MTDLLAHRGPDERGVRCDAWYALGNRRLRIIDLAMGQQPLSNEDGTLWITYNGEVYNFASLRAELESRGHRFRTRSDTETIVHAYEEWGEDCPAHLDGMFAFAIVDERRRRLFLARDRLGVKPLYYARCGNDLVFGSEVKVILAHPEAPRRPDFGALPSYLRYRYVLGERTLYEGIHSLLPGHVLVFQEGDWRTRAYWDIPIVAEREDRGQDYYLERVRALVTEAVRERLISEVSLGAYLSGGLDSSVVVALMAQLMGEGVRTYSIGFSEAGFNEQEYARQVAERYHTHHTDIMLTGMDYFGKMPDLIRFKDAPLSVPNEVPIYEMSRVLKQDITVVLSGEGADELFGGYGRIFRSPYDYARMHALRADPALLNGDGGRLFWANMRAKYGDQTFASPADHFLASYGYFKDEEVDALLSPDLGNPPSGQDWASEHFRGLFDRVRGLSHYDQYLWVFEKAHLLGLLHRLDTTTMATSVEARTPFVDYQLVEFMAQVPLHYKLRWRSDAHLAFAGLLNSDQISERFDNTKQILRDAFRADLPSSIIERRKMGFPVPLANWFQGAFASQAREVLLDGTTRRRGVFDVAAVEGLFERLGRRYDEELGKQIWMLMNVELWLRMYFDR